MLAHAARQRVPQLIVCVGRTTRTDGFPERNIAPRHLPTGVSGRRWLRFTQLLIARPTASRPPNQPPVAVTSQRRFTRAADSHEFDVHFFQSATVARSPSVAVVTWVMNVKGVPSNNPIKQTVQPVTQLACASGAPVWPAAYRVR